MKNYLTLQGFDDGSQLIDTFFFINTTFRKSILLPSSSNEECKPVDPFQRAILSHWVPQKHSTF